MTFPRNMLFVFFFLTQISAYSQSSLLQNEQNTIEIFQKSSPKVVYIQRFHIDRKHPKNGQVPDGAGSGIIWDAKGHVVTNYHVIKDASHVEVMMGMEVARAKVIGAEPRKDIAILQIQSPKALASLKNFKPLVLAPKRELVVGQKTIAIGNPFGLDHSLTVGVVSALGRQFPGVGQVSIHDAIQTDAAINPGNSGGPLLDSQGRLIGMNTAMFSQNGGSAGIGFAVPAENVEHVVSQIISHGRVVLAGIGIERAEPEVAERLGVKEGILIANILPNTPAHKAKFLVTKRDHWGRTQLGDVIISINDKPVNDYDSFYNTFSTLNVGEEVKVTLLRHGKKISKKIKTIDIAAY
jgi:S1-C subfamily serine protease